MQITYATEGAPGHASEDYVACGTNWAVVLDGATAPPGVDSGCVHDVGWLVRRLARALSGRLVLGFGGWSLEDLLALSIKDVRDLHAETCDLENPDSPSSTVSIVRVRGDVLDYLTLGDSPLVIRAPGGALRPVFDDRTAHLPGGRPYTIELVRSLRNKPDGFWVASTDPEAAFRAITGSAPWGAGTEVGIFTDGVTRLVEFFGYDWERVFSALEATGPAGLIALVRAAEQASPLAHGKQHDDATAVLMTGDRLPARTPVRRPRDWRTLVDM
jgi:Protein phosphatase 2C